MTDTATRPKLKPEIKTEWLAALRSDDYEQDEGRLVDEDGKYCCLGVLCDVVTKRTKRHIPRSLWEGNTMPPMEVVKYVGLAHVRPDDERLIDFDPETGNSIWKTNAKRNGEYRDLNELNDGGNPHSFFAQDTFKRLTFKQIADVIERDF